MVPQTLFLKQRHYSTIKINSSRNFLITELLQTLVMTWHVERMKLFRTYIVTFSNTEQAAFIMIVENAIRKHGIDNLSDVTNEVRSECQNEWPASGQFWVVLYDTNGAFNISYGTASKKIFIKDSGKNDCVWAARI